AERIQSIGPEIMFLGSIDRTRAYDESGELLVGDEGVSELAAGYVDAWNGVLPDVGRIIAIRGTPVPNYDVPECLAQATEDVSECELGAEDGGEEAGEPFVRAVAAVPEAALLDMNDVICPGGPPC